MKINFIVQGKVQAKQRPRFNRYSGKTYTPNETIAYENWVKDCYFRSISSIDNKPTDKPLKVKIIAYYEVPRSASKKKKLQMLHNEIFPTIKPDTDNIAKSILDSLNGIAYLDDKQVVKLEVEKYYSQVSSVSVMIEEIEAK